MNYEREDTNPQRVTRSEFDALVQRIIAAIAQPVIQGNGALAKLREFGISGSLSFQQHWTPETTVWEHPEITRHNTKMGSKGILNCMFFTLYARVDTFELAKGDHADYARGYIEFCLGRVGNTYHVGRTFDVVADPPVEPVEDPQLTLTWTEVTA